MENRENWIAIFKSADKFDVELKQAKLKEGGIESHIHDHLDSMIKNLNDTNYGVALLVHPEDTEVAKALIQEA